MRIIKRRAIMRGLFGGSRFWLALGGIVFVGGKIKELFGFGEPEPVFVEEIDPARRVVVAHSETSSRRMRRDARRARKAKR